MSVFALPNAPRSSYSTSSSAGPSKGKGRDEEERDSELDRPSKPPQRVNVGVPEITAVQGLVPTLQWVSTSLDRFVERSGMDTRPGSESRVGCLLERRAFRARSERDDPSLRHFMLAFMSFWTSYVISREMGLELNLFLPLLPPAEISSLRSTSNAGWT